MKKLIPLFTLLIVTFTVAPWAEARDKDKDRDKYYEEQKKYWKETRDDVREVQQQYSRVVSTYREQGGSRDVRQDIDAIGGEVQRVTAQFERGYGDLREIRGRCSRIEGALARVRQQMEYERNRRNSYYGGGFRDRYR